MNYFSLLAKKKLDIFFAGHKIESMDEKLPLLFNGERGQALPLEWHGSTTCFHDTSKHIPQMTNEPTPDTDAMFTDNVPEDAQIVAFCERLERERNSARAERDAARETAHDNSVFWSARDGNREVQHYKASPVEASKLIMAMGNERDALRADVARLRAALEEMLIAEMRVRKSLGWTGREVESQPHLMAARVALAAPAQ